MTLAIANREPSHAPLEPGLPVWRTCLREVTFADAADELPIPSPLIEGDAYRLLLEILCGLQSPMLGETQVMGQFKAFLSSLGRDQVWLNRLGQRLLADARDIRTQHLMGLGSRSYGSAVRRYLADCSHTVLIGTGKLGQEVLPFLADDGRSVDHWGRTPDPASPADVHGATGGAPAPVTYRSLTSLDTFDASSRPAVLIIAAPVPSEAIERVAAHYTGLLRVIDLRGELGSAPLHLTVPIVTLQDLFAQMTESNAFAARHVEAARTEIASRSRRYELRDELRPFGWDDLCA